MLQMTKTSALVMSSKVLNSRKPEHTCNGFSNPTSISSAHNLSASGCSHALTILPTLMSTTETSTSFSAADASPPPFSPASAAAACLAAFAAAFSAAFASFFAMAFNRFSSATGSSNGCDPPCGCCAPPSSGLSEVDTCAFPPLSLLGNAVHFTSIAEKSIAPSLSPSDNALCIRLHHRTKLFFCFNCPEDIVCFTFSLTMPNKTMSAKVTRSFAATCDFVFKCSLRDSNACSQSASNSVPE
mmetsp:Transcript_6123/g.20511  ORF Transcript_6123/g.20511 Transcript_6123/m.20511 type:complete len:242 (+) Transcript_6123:1477-2202(+)